MSATQYEGTTLGTTNLTFSSILMHYYAFAKNKNPYKQRV